MLINNSLKYHSFIFSLVSPEIVLVFVENKVSESIPFSSILLIEPHALVHHQLPVVGSKVKINFFIQVVAGENVDLLRIGTLRCRENRTVLRPEDILQELGSSLPTETTLVCKRYPRNLLGGHHLKGAPSLTVLVNARTSQYLYRKQLISCQSDMLCSESASSPNIDF